MPPPPGYHNSPLVIVGLGGASRSGKSRLARAFVTQHCGAIKMAVLDQDSFWRQAVHVSTESLEQYGADTFKDNESTTTTDDKVVVTHEDYACTDWDGFTRQLLETAQELRKQCLQTSATTVGVLIVEGFQVFYDPRIVDQMDLLFYLHVDKETVVQRRINQTCRWNHHPQSRHYCENILWPTHKKYQETAVKPLGNDVSWLEVLPDDDDDDKDNFEAIFTQVSVAIQQRLDSVKVYTKLSGNYKHWQSAPAETRGEPVILVSTGSYNPIHLQHVQLFEHAKTSMERAGYACLAGFLSPSHDDYVRGKLRKAEFIAGAHRLRMVDLATQHSSWLSVHPWEMLQNGFVDFGPTLHQIKKQVYEWLGKSSKVQVRYLCGMDHALKCQLFGSYGASLGLVALSRPGTNNFNHLSAQQRQACEQRGILVLQDESLLSLETSAASSTAVRRAIVKGSPQSRIEFLDLRVDRYLREKADDIGGIYRRLALAERNDY